MHRATRTLTLLPGLLIASAAFGQNGSSAEPNSTLTLVCRTFDLKTGAPAPGLPVNISTGVDNGSMSHLHVDFGRPKAQVTPPQKSQGNSGPDALYPFDLLMPSFAGTYTIYCSIPGWVSYTKVDSRTNRPMSPILHWPTGFERPDGDCRHSTDCYVAYLNRQVMIGATGVMLVVHQNFSNATFKAKRVGTKDGGEYDSDQFIPWRAPGGDRHDTGDEIDFIVTGANIDEVAALFRSMGCQVLVTGFNTIHVKFPAVPIRPIRPPGRG